jgi:hypothetical protein
MDREPTNSKNNSAVFSRISAKKPSGKGKWRSNWGDQGVRFVKFTDRGDNHGMDKNPLFTAFPHSATLFHILGDLPSNRFYERLFFKRLFAVFWGNNGILGFIPKLCARIRIFMQPGMTFSPKRAKPGPYWAPFCSRYLMSVMLITASKTTSNLI